MTGSAITANPPLRFAAPGDGLPPVNAEGTVQGPPVQTPQPPKPDAPSPPRIPPWVGRTLGRAVRGLDLLIPDPVAPGSYFADMPTHTPAERAIVERGMGRIANGEDPQQVRRETRRELDEERRRTQPRREDENVQVQRKKCIVGRHGDLKNICKGIGQQSHHIVPDQFVRSGSRRGSSSRIISEDDGAAICVPGNAFVSGTLHSDIHADLNRALASKAGGSASGELPLSEVIGSSLRTTVAYRPECTADIVREVGRAFQGVDTSQPVRVR